ncbi:diiron oxygenase [Aquabacterium soli]|uniref:Diiron oxygenase n=1 Tax=Aquabacterium soli TaxID=2493092 RepID=A0A3R8U5Q5_9BURK|nr:diiron oxygenase [Aquabacterium soli]
MQAAEAVIEHPGQPLFHSLAGTPHAPHAPSRSVDLLNRIARSWSHRAQVKKNEPDTLIDAGTDLPEFLEHLLPFHEHPRYQALDTDTKMRILSCGWIIYNEKTVAIELDIVSPVCQDILYDNVPGLDNELSKEIVCETLVDEAYHLLLVKNANRITRQRRQLEHIRIPQFALVRQMREEQDRHMPSWAGLLVRLSTAVVSEIFISDYLHQLSEETSIQPLNRATVAAHRHDELAHSKIFSELTRNFYHALGSTQKGFFASMLPKSIHWFADQELDLWLDVLQQLGVPGAQAMVEECRELNRVALDRLDYSGVVKLASEVGILDSAEGHAAFRNARLI